MPGAFEKGGDMRHRHVIVGIAIVAVLGVTGTAVAQLSEEYRGWADGPVSFLFTDDDAKAWKKVSTDAEAKQFIELFFPQPSGLAEGLPVEYIQGRQLAKDQFV